MTKKQAAKSEFVTEGGMVIELRRIDPVFIQWVTRSVTMPEVPTYEVKTFSGRIEKHKMDPESAAETEGGLALWEQYLKDVAEAEAEQTERSIRAVLLEGTQRPDPFFDEKWERRMKIIGVTVPDDPDEYWVQYLTTSLTSTDITSLFTAVIRMTGVPEEVIQRAEESFRDSVRDGQRPGELEESSAN
jgi:hypothetical protein